MALTYTTYVAALENLAIIPQNTTDQNFASIIPSIIDYAEDRIYRELDFLCTLATQTATSGALMRSVSLPTNIIVTQSMNVITPASAVNPELGTRNPLQRVSVDFINSVYTSSAGAGVPKDYAVIGAPVIGGSMTVGSYNILLGPWPDQGYTLEILGTVRPSPISPSNPTTFLSTQCPDLLLAASMIFVAGYQRDYGQQSDDPNLAQSWERQYQALKDSLNLEELRRKASSVQWTPMTPTPQANVPRDRASN